MKKCLSAILLLALSLGLRAAEVKVEFRKMAEGTTGNQRAPMIAENARGERIYTFRGSDRYAHYFYYKNGTWSGGGRVPGSPQFDDYWYSDIVADSTGTFHYVCEEADHAMYYARFQNGAWTAPLRKIDVRHEATLALGVRSDDTIVLVAPLVARNPKGMTKDVLVGTKPKAAGNFSGFKNVTNDYEPSTMVDAAIDAKDNTWISYKGVFFKGQEETMQAVLLGLDKNNKEIYFKNVSGQEAAWCWYPRLAINSDGLIMVTWIMSQARTYFYRLYDPAKDKWTEVKALAAGTTSPWPLMYNKLLARGPDFFWVGLSGNRTLALYQYDAEKNAWNKLADVSQGGANWFSACNGADSILISWESQTSPASCYLTTVTADFKPIIRIQSVANLKVEKHVERGFFHGYTLNVLAWEANPVNTENEIVIAAQKVYRKLRTEDASKWALLTQLAADVRTYEDRNIPAGSDYVYAVTCVDDKGVESPIIDEGQGAAATAGVPERRIDAERKDR